MIKVIVFDLWRTLIPATIDFTHLFSLVKKTDLSVPEFVSEYERAVQIKKYNSFEELHKDFLKYFKQEPTEILEQELYEIYFNRFDKINYYPEVKTTLEKLKEQGYKLGLLSNTESIKKEILEDKLELKKYFDFLGYSFEVGAIKPDSKMFKAVLSNFNIKAEEALMVGDSLRSDIAGSQKLGMHNCLIERDGFEKKFHASITPEFKISSLGEIFNILDDINAKKKN
jgi:2-haloalkanoic acid dehalogenase type II